VKLSESELIPSDTITVMVYVPGAWSAVGVQEKSPLVLIEAPAGVPAPRVNLRVCPGSGSVAVAVKASTASPANCLLPIV